MELSGQYYLDMVVNYSVMQWCVTLKSWYIHFSTMFYQKFGCFQIPMVARFMKSCPT
jgi:hypothetical protein